MGEWFSTLTFFEQSYWVIAGISSIIFIFVLISTFLIGDTDGVDGDVDADIESDTGIGFQFFTFKNLVAFFTIFSWAGITCIEAGYGKTITILVSSVSGLMMMLFMASLIHYINKLVSSGTLKLENAIGNVGEVYLTIGGNRSKIGKVHVNIQGALRELDALADSEETLKTGTVIKVTEITGTGILIVQPINKNKHDNKPLIANH
ncbi:hypothetical protein IMCC3317_32920 [Kordia antarctica]|uniref:NfeD-like C-terminal domain-containing protein n=1 Tax=Kordia antarctica TaxID=1218801 RepID=A0A7L4ZN95_9FLAO|nr:hypothetical protein [Kordia antarctica]QHI37909.1 hypothetical protein IMCC3317_32920 [Kordia antarctica]